MGRIEGQEIDKETIALQEDIFYDFYCNLRGKMLDKIEKENGSRDEKLADVMELELLKELIPEEEHKLAERMQKIDPKNFRETLVMVAVTLSQAEKSDTKES